MKNAGVDRCGSASVTAYDPLSGRDARGNYHRETWKKAAAIARSEQRLFWSMKTKLKLWLADGIGCLCAERKNV